MRNFITRKKTNTVFPSSDSPKSGDEEIPEKFHFWVQISLGLAWICSNPSPVAIYNVIKW